MPLLAAVADGPHGILPDTQTGVSVSRPGVLVTAFGQNPDGDGTVLRVWEQTGNSDSLTVKLPADFHATRAIPVNLRGESAGNAVKIRNGSFTFNLAAFAPASFRLE